MKTSSGYFSGTHLRLDESRRLLRDTARDAVASARGITPVEVDLPVTIELDLSPDPVEHTPLGARADDNQRFVDEPWGDEPLSDIDLVLATHPGTTSPKPGTVAFTCEDFPTAYATLHAILAEVYERDIENLIDVVAEPEAYARTDLDDIVGDHPVTERHAEAGGKALVTDARPLQLQVLAGEPRLHIGCKPERGRGILHVLFQVQLGVSHEAYLGSCHGEA